MKLIRFEDPVSLETKLVRPSDILEIQVEIQEDGEVWVSIWRDKWLTDAGNISTELHETQLIFKDSTEFAFWWNENHLSDQ